MHALNRFTFGPRPGDVDVLRAIGLDNWFEQQLHPQSLDLTDLDARLSEYPAMQWNTADLLFRLPSNALIRQALNGKYTVPERGIEHAIYENQMERVSAKQQAKAQNKEVAANAPLAPAGQPPAAMGGTNTMSGEGERAENPVPMAKEPASAASAPSEPGQMNMATADNEPTLTVTTAEIDAVLDLPPGQRVARLAAMRQSEIDAFLHALKPLEKVQLAAGLTPEQKQLIGALDNPERVVAEELIAQRLTRDIYSTAQLQEVMTDFWFNHFNVYLRKNETMPYELVSYERDVIRPHALGKFEDLLEATAHSPAMMMYLDNSESIGPHSMAAERAEIAAARRPGNQKKVHQGLNENYARELMELHTLGVNGGYTQADVTQVARILTGWTVEQPLRGGGFAFDPNRHEPGNVKALGQKFKDRGEMEGRDLLHYLATRPATAQFLSRELALRFVSDEPPQSLVDRLAKSYLSSGGDITAMLRTLYRSPEFWSTTTYRAKVKTPLEFVVSAVRATNANTANLRPIAEALRQMGMPLYGCVPPTGYDWKSSSWVSTGALVDRMNFALNLAANRLPGVTTDWKPQTEDPAQPAVAQNADPAAEETRLEAMLVAGGVSDSTRAAVLDQFQKQMGQSNNGAVPQPVAAIARAGQKPAANAVALERKDQLLAGLLIGSPEFQRR
ncbi:MAG TPA: DUF1800 domain-containing protein [Terracidiphilus sp.]|nr:DUF1800 domain-containing protein [Terracidiphilus sp.]